MDAPHADRTPATTAPLARLGRWCHDRRVVVLVLWFAVLAAIGAGTGALGSGFATEFSLPNVESQRGLTILDDAFGGQGGSRGGTIVFEADQGVTDPSVRGPMQSFFDQLGQLDDVTVISPYSDLGARQIAQQGPLVGKVAYADLQLPRASTSSAPGRSATRSSASAHRSRASASSSGDRSSPTSSRPARRPSAWPSPS